LSCTLELFYCTGVDLLELGVGVLSVCTVGDNVQFLVERGVLCSATGTGETKIPVNKIGDQ
jgi:hypothetical protein